MARRTSRETDEDLDIEELESEEQDKDISPTKYEIFTYPADYTLEGLVEKFRKKVLLIPPFQRRFVWTIKQSSKLIESFLLGLPVPPVFLYVQPDNKLLVVDGQQRLRSIVYFFEGAFGEEENGKRPVFRLTGLNEKSPFAGKTIEEIKDKDDASYRRLTESVLRSVMIKQLKPEDDTSIYHVFERLNTGATRLHSQELRNCIYHGKFNRLLIKLNKLEAWRTLLGRKAEDRRRRDVEMILRFFALHYWPAKYFKPMTDFLNKFMLKYRDPDPDELKEYTDLFEKTIGAILEALGPKPFHVRAGMNLAAFDAVAIAFASHLDDIPTNIKTRFKRLLADSTFDDYTTSRTTNEEIVKARLALANKKLFGGKS